VKTAFCGCSDVGAVAAGGASKTAVGAGVGWVMGSCDRGLGFSFGIGDGATSVRGGGGCCSGGGGFEGLEVLRVNQDNIADNPYESTDHLSGIIAKLS
jgi:hypothetical protein